MKNEKGFTLIELMIVVAIIGILAAVAIPRFADLIDRAKEAQTKGNLSSLRSAVSIYYGSNQGEAPYSTTYDSSTDEDTAADLQTALVDEYISSIPSGEVPFIDTDDDGESNSSASWEQNVDATFNNYGSPTNPEVTDGWSYDPNGPNTWIGISGADTGGESIHSW
ncbi:MAG: type II secretion system protein [Elusimicrobiota bacterium]